MGGDKKPPLFARVPVLKSPGNVHIPFNTTVLPNAASNRILLQAHYESPSIACQILKNALREKAPANTSADIIFMRKKEVK
jgi:hypothetical protein